MNHAREWARRRWLELTLAVSLGVISHNASALDPSKSIFQYVHTGWASKEGAPTLSFNFAQTPDGYLWWGTDEGLYRFDGVQFEPIRSLDGYAIPRQVMPGVIRAPSGFWLDFGKQNYRFQNGRLEKWGDTRGWPEAVRDVVVEANGVTWVATETRQLWRLENGNRELVGERWGYPFNNVSSLLMGPDGTLWVSNAGSPGGIAYLESGARKFKQIPSDVSDIALHPNGSIWLIGAQGIRVITVAAGRVATSTWVTRGSCGTQILLDRDGGLWAGCFGGLVHYGKATDLLLPGAEALLKSQLMTIKDGMSSSILWFIREDRDGNVWVGGDAIDRFRNTKFTQVVTRNSTEDPPSSIVAGVDATVWATAFNEGILRLKATQIPELNKTPKRIEILHHSITGELWAAGVGGVWRADDQGHFAPVELPRGMIVDSVDAVTQDAPNSVWLTMLGGIKHLVNLKWSQPIVAQGFPANWSALSAVTDAQGRVWFGGYDNDLLLVENDRARLMTAREDGLAVGQVRLLYRHGEHLWASGPDGVALYDGQHFRALVDESGVAFHDVTGIAETKRGELWLHGKDAAWRISADELAKALPRLERGVHARRYDESDGRRGASAMSSPRSSVIEATDGRLWFSTTVGIAWLDPDEKDAPVVPLVTYVRSLVVDAHEVPITDHIRLPVNAERIAFSYAAPYVGVPERIRYRYRLDGVDTDWVDSRGLRSATYTKLAPGAYRFHVMAKLEDGVWGDEAHTITVTAPTPWFQRAWFRTLIGALALLCAWLLYRVRVAMISASIRLRVTARQNERERIARELHDTLLQGFHGTIWIFAAMTERLHQDEPVKVQLSKALDEAELILARSRDQIMGVRGDTTERLDLHAAIETAGRALASNSATTLDFRVIGARKELRDDICAELLAIVTEALRNALRHSQCSHIDTSIEYKKRRLTLVVADDGLGVSEHFQHDGRPGHGGIRGMRERARIIGATLSLQSNRPRGTEVVVCLTAGKAYRGARRWTSVFGRGGPADHSI
jgi:signal transduction histidine kinase/ligand-binding sensor domain-containing protein